MTGKLQLPTLTGAAVSLRPFGPSDLAAIVAASADRRITAVTTVPEDADEDGARAYIDRQHGRVHRGEGWSWAVDVGGEAVGNVTVMWRSRVDGRASVGYWVVPGRRGNGFAVSGVTLAAEWALTQVGVSRLELYVEPWNVVSRVVAERAGFVHEGLLANWLRIDDEPRDAHMYALLP